jgi:hypothetical protein
MQMTSMSNRMTEWTMRLVVLHTEVGSRSAHIAAQLHVERSKA